MNLKLFRALAALLAAAAPLCARAAAPTYSGSVYHVKACDGVVPVGVARCHAHIVSDQAGNRLLKPAVTTVSGPPGYGPADLRSAYKLTATGSSSTIVAVVDAYGYPNAERDLGVYRAQFKLPACTTANGCFTKYNEAGQKLNYPATDVGWAEETALDLQMVSAMCPNCKIILVEANSASLPDLAASVNRAAALGARVITNSYGGSEGGTSTFETAYNHPGVAITVSAGDSGYGPQFPATSPHVIAVGGTSLMAASNARGWTEAAWVDGGSGCSTLYPKPSWQKDVLCTKRMVADISAVADPGTGVAVYAPYSATQSAWMVFGGTSVSAPLVGGIYGTAGASVTYGSTPYAHATALNDVVKGANGSCGGLYFCTAEQGYDGPTGLGTPIGATAF